MGDRCFMSGWLFLPSVLTASRQNSAATRNLLDALDIDTEEILDEARTGKSLIREFEVQEVNYAASSELTAAAPAGLIGEFHNAAGGEYGSGTTILDGTAAHFFTTDTQGREMVPLEYVFETLQEDVDRGVLPKDYVTALRQRVCPGLESQEWLHGLFGIFCPTQDSKSAGTQRAKKSLVDRRKKLQRLCGMAAADPSKAAILLKFAGVLDAGLIKTVSRVPKIAADVLQARPDIKDRMLELAAAGIAEPVVERSK